MIISKKSFLNKVIFIFFLFNLVFNVVLFGFLDRQFNFTYADEISYLLLLVVWLFLLKKRKSERTFIIILLFYVIYSWFIKSNSFSGIALDVIIQSKPYMTFFICYHSGVVFSSTQNKILRQLCIVLFSYLVIMGFMYLFINDNIMYDYFYHISAFGSAVAIISIFYFLTLNTRSANKFRYISMLSLGLISARSKFYGYFFVNIIILFFVKKANIKFSLKNSWYTLFVLAGVLFVSKDKISAYFFPDQFETTARSALYSTSVTILYDYFPLGSGYASFGTHASREYYSKIYDKYKLSSIWGLTESNPLYISDTFYPSLAQFGVVGIVLFIIFWIHIIKEMRKYKLRKATLYSNNINNIFILILSYLAIESVANAILTSSLGLAVMSILALVLNKMRVLKNEEIKNFNTSISLITNNSVI